MNELKVLLIGGIYDLNLKPVAKYVGKEIVTRGYVLVTGACQGSPYEAVVSASNINGSKIIGFSPAKNKEEHLSNKLNAPIEYFTKMIFHNGKFNFNNNPNLSLLERELNMIAYSDIGIMLGGDTGAFSELTTMCRVGKPIGVLTNTEHFSKLIPSVYNLGVFGNKQIIFGNDPSKLLDDLVELYQKNYNKLL